MHKSSSSSSRATSWKVILIIALVLLSIILTTLFQLHKTLDAVKEQSKRSTGLKNSIPINKKDNDEDHHHQDENNNQEEDTDGGDLGHKKLLEAVDLNNLPPYSKKSNGKGKHKSEKEDLSDIKNFKNTAVTKLAPKILHSLKKIDLESERETDAFVSHQQFPIIEADNDEKNNNNLDIELFVIWHDALDKTHKILADIRKKFYVLAIDYFDWNSERMSRSKFETNLWRLYNGKGGWVRKGMSLKVKQCGYGPFIALVVVDPQPKYQVEKTAHGDDTVNHNMNAAKKLYRGWSGGGFRVHGTFGPQEAAHDIPLLFHRSSSDFVVIAKNMMKKKQKKARDGDGNNNDDDSILLVDQFVKNLRKFDLESSSSSIPIIKPFMMKFKQRLLPQRDVFFETSQDDGNLHSEKENEKTSWKLDSAIHNKRDAVLLRHRDSIYLNDFVTARETFGQNGWNTCRDLLAVLKSYQESKQITKIVGRTSSHAEEGDDESAVVISYSELVTQKKCEDWPNEIEIHIVDDEKVRWGVSSLFASSASDNIYGKKKKENGPIAFDGIQLMHSVKTETTKKLIKVSIVKDGK